jgi:hypothetical protein
MRKLVLLGICPVLMWFFVAAIFPEFVITSIHVGKRTYHVHWQL